MPRPLRIQYPGARYHVMCRGNRGGIVFSDDRDVRLFLKTVTEAAERFDLRIHAYVLMSTHYHLLLETPSGNLVDAMSWLQGTFTQRMNAMHQTWGHLFQGRYKAKIIDDEDPTYFRVVANYIHLNPAEAGLLPNKSNPKLKTYAWSSLPLYLQKPSARPEWLVTSEVLAVHQLRDTPKGRLAFEALMNRRSQESIMAKSTGEAAALERGWVHGNELFRQRMVALLEESVPDQDHRIYDRTQRRDLAEAAVLKTIQIGVKHLGLKRAELPSLKKGDPSKLILATYIKQHYSVSNQWICDQLSMGSRSLVGNCHNLVQNDKGLKKRYQALESYMAKQK